ncbi:alpha-L-fucosidase [Leifsonia aquatica]|uniref:alpha-L-fucosidase n=1 Tax=Leifsonia aquatica TaxID=144185 RepID=UPI00385026B6
MFEDDPVRPENYQRFAREVPEWFTDAKLGIFVHWGPYSVPAWAEPIGELGTIEDRFWYAHNPYAEWYYNTIRIEGSPAAEHQREVYGDAPYDDFIDQWDPAEFDPDEFVALVVSTGARYVVPTTKHHDGVTLWDAPGTRGRNTVARGPRRDLVGAFEKAARDAGLRFGVYYSGGLDWHFSQLPPITDDGAVFGSRPLEAAIASASDEPWLRWTRTGGTANAFVDAVGDVRLPGASGAVDAASARLADGTPLAVARDAGALVATLPEPAVAGPVLVRFDLAE